jgi:hypothetical protein
MRRLREVKGWNIAKKCKQMLEKAELPSTVWRSLPEAARRVIDDEWVNRLPETGRPNEVIRHARPPKPFNEMTGAEYLAWDNTHGFGAAMRPPPRRRG